ncbi:MAG: response regulator [Verrucomicrobia bacterium]|nr:response regulator [Verrucomicrobiota bacterium]
MQTSRADLDLQTETLTLSPPNYDTAATREASRSVLLVDDDQAVRGVLVMMLESMGFQVESADSAEKALELLLAKASSYAFLLSDFSMPSMNGWRLAEAAALIRTDLPVIIMSGDADSQLHTQGPSSSTAGFIQKPFRPTELSDLLQFLGVAHDPQGM